MAHRTLRLEKSGPRATVTLARPEVHNALNPELIRELTAAFQELGADPSVRVVILAAGGKSFCAGADLHWMRAAVNYTWEENVREARELGEMLRAIQSCPKPVIARVHGAAFGGGVGLVAACDLAVAIESARLCFSEAKLGLIPAVISPLVLARMGPGPARRYFLTAERLSAAEARRLGLLSEVAASAEELDRVVDGWVTQLTANGPEAVAACKRLIDDGAGIDWEAVLPRTAEAIAARRASAEGQEGMRAFLEKRPPGWAIPGEAGDVS